MSDTNDDWGDPAVPTPTGDPGASADADQPAAHANDERPLVEPANPADDSNPADPAISAVPGEEGETLGPIDAAASGTAMAGDPPETGVSGDPDLDVSGEAGVPVDASAAGGMGEPGAAVDAGALGDRSETADPVDAGLPGDVDGWGVPGGSAETGTSGVPGDVLGEGGPGEHLDADEVGSDEPVGGGERAGVGDEIGTDEAIAAIESAERVRDASKRAIEALVMVAEEPLASNLLGQLLEVSPVVVDRLCEELAVAYEQEGRGFQMVRVAGGWRYQSHPDQSVYVERFVLQGQTAKLSVAALETLAIVAYKQPVSRAQVASIRGVSVDGVMRTLEQRGYIAEIGKDPGPGQAVLFGTTPLFLEKVGLDNIDELPPLGDFVPGADVVEQLEQGLRPDRMPLRPEDAMAPGGAPGDGGDDEAGDGFGDAGGFDLLAGMGEIAGISLSDDDRTADSGDGGEMPEPIDANGSGDDGIRNGATNGANGAAAAYGASVWDLRPDDEPATPNDEGEGVDLRDARSGRGEGQGDDGLGDDE